jgi:hypothetical protein
LPRWGVPVVVMPVSTCSLLLMFRFATRMKTWG